MGGGRASKWLILVELLVVISFSSPTPGIGPLEEKLFRYQARAQFAS
jgi:hypothetical protein